MGRIGEGDVFWAELQSPKGRRPLVVVQADWVTRSGIGTVICVPLTTNLSLAEAPGNVLLERDRTGLSKDSVAVVSAVVALDRRILGARVSTLARNDLRRVVAGIDLVLAE